MVRPRRNLQSRIQLQTEAFASTHSEMIDASKTNKVKKPNSGGP